MLIVKRVLRVILVHQEGILMVMLNIMPKAVGRLNFVSLLNVEYILI